MPPKEKFAILSFGGFNAVTLQSFPLIGANLNNWNIRFNADVKFFFKRLFFFHFLSLVCREHLKLLGNRKSFRQLPGKQKLFLVPLIEFIVWVELICVIIHTSLVLIIVWIHLVRMMIQIDLCLCLFFICHGLSSLFRVTVFFAFRVASIPPESLALHAAGNEVSALDMVYACFVFALGQGVFRFVVADPLLVPADDCASGKKKQEEQDENCEELVHCNVHFFCPPLIQVPVPFDCIMLVQIIALILYIVIFEIADRAFAVAIARAECIVVTYILVDYFWADLDYFCKGWDCFGDAGCPAPGFRIVLV